MKENWFSCLAVLLSLARASFAAAPTPEEVKRDLLLPIAIRESSEWLMAGFAEDGEMQVLDLASTDLGPVGEPGRYTIRFRFRFRTTADVYGRGVAQLPNEEEIVLVRIARAGRSCFEAFEFDVESVTTERGKVWRFARPPSRGKVEWDAGAVPSGVGTRACWEAQAAVTGERLVFFDSVRAARDYAERRTAR